MPLIVRLISLVILCLGAASFTSVVAQAAPDTELPPGITIVKYSWTKSTPRTAPFSTTVSNTQEQIVLPAPAGSSQPIYHYSMEIKNDGAKAITAIRWNYIFDEPDSQQELGVIKLGSYEKIGPQSTKALLIHSTASPPRLVTAQNIGEDERSGYAERVTIQCVLYKDLSVWENPGAAGVACEELRQWLSKRGKLKS